MVASKKAVGIVRRIDELGRIVIPKELRRSLRCDEGTPMEIFADDTGDIIIRKYAPGCVVCNTLTGLIEYKGLRLCSACIREMVRALAS